MKIVLIVILCWTVLSILFALAFGRFMHICEERDRERIALAPHPAENPDAGQLVLRDQLRVAAQAPSFRAG